MIRGSIARGVTVLASGVLLTSVPALGATVYRATVARTSADDLTGDCRFE